MMRRGAKRGVRLARLRRDDGQSLIVVAVILVVLLGMAGLVIDVGELYVTQRHLQTAADAAALAAAQDLPGSTGPTMACTYSASPAGTTTCGVDDGSGNLTNLTMAVNGNNYQGSFGNVQTSSLVECLSADSAGATCQTGPACANAGGYAPAGSPQNPGCNAIKVTEQTTVTPFFMQIFGIGGQKVTASATSGIAGGTPHPLNVEVIDDTTGSMQCPQTRNCPSGFTGATICNGLPTDVPSGVLDSLTQEDCAKAGIRQFLTQLLPCYQSASSCGSIPTTDQTNAPLGALDDVGLITFPGLTGSLSTAADRKTPIAVTNCTKDVPGNAPGYPTTSSSYQIVPFSSDFRLNDTPTRDPLATLNPFSNLVRTVYWPGDGCPNGGYPTQGGSTSSIGGGGSGDTSSANNNTSPPIAAGGSATTTGSGVTLGNSQTATNTSSVGVTRGNSTGTTNGVAGGPNSGSPGDTATTTQDSSSSITLNEPANASNGDFLLATITAQGGSVGQNSRICEPNGWSLVDQQWVSGSVLQATFSTTLANGTSFRFNFRNGSCSFFGGSGISLNSSAVVLRYTNVSGVDVAAGNSGGGTSSFAGSAPSGSSWTQGAMTDSNPSIGSAAWGSALWYASVSSGGHCTSSASCDTTLAAGQVTGATFTFTSGGTARRQVFTVKLLINDNPASGNSTCTIGSTGRSGTGSTTCTISGTWNVNAGAKISLSVQLTNGNGTLSSTAFASATENVAATTHYVSLASSCISTTVTDCHDAAVQAPGGALTSASLTFGSNVPAGDTFTVTLLKNDNSSGLSCPITATHNNCTITGTLSFAANDNMELQVTRTAGTADFTTTSTTNTAATVASDGTTLVAPSVTTTNANDQVVRLYGTGATGFASGNAPVLAVSGSSTATGADDGTQSPPGPGPTNTASVKSNASDNWVAQTVALAPAASSSSITIQAPAGYAPGSGFLLATIAVSNISGASICTANGWTAVVGAATNGTVTQQSFYTTSVAAGSSSTFNFRTNCNQSSTGVRAGASAVAVNYTGVDPTTPFDSVAPQRATGSDAAPAPPALTAGNPTNSIDDTVVSLFATAAASLTVPNGGAVEKSLSASTGITDMAVLQPGPYIPGKGSTAPNAAAWLSQTLALKAALPMSITIPAVTGYSPTNGKNDLLLASITVRALGSAVICPPDANWNQLATTTSGSGASQITQTDFWTTASTSYAFTFNSSSNCQGNNLVPAAASAVATNYEGVNAASVLSKATPNGGSTSSTLTAPDVTTTQPYSEVVSTFGTLDSWASGTAPALQNPSSPWVNVGTDSTIQAAAGDQTTPQQEHTTNPAYWTGITVGLSPLLSSSVTVTPPTGYVGGGADLMIVTVAVRNLGNGCISPPDSSWSKVPLSTGSPVQYTVKSGTVTEEAFYTTASNASSDTFSFYAQQNCNGAAVNLGASAAAVYYTGVSTASPFDATPVPASGSSATLQPGSITTTVAGDELVTLFGSADSTLNTSVAVAGNGLSPAVGVNNVNPPPQNDPGANQPASATSTASADWAAETIALQPLLKTGIVVQRPASPNANDFLVVTVTASGLPSGDNICAPNDGTWSELNGAMATTTGNGLSQATWYGFRYSNSPESYTFTFETSCSASGTPVTASATALAVRFTGVNPITPVDADTSVVPAALEAGTTKGVDGGSSTTVGPTATVQPTHTGDWAITMFGTGATGISMSSGCGSGYTGFRSGTTGTASATGFCGRISPNSNQNFTMGSATASSTGKPYVTDTLVLESASGGCGSSCEYGLEVGGSTDYGLAIKAAIEQFQSLVQSDPSRATARNVIILLSDGDANTNPTNNSNAWNYTPFPCNLGIQQAEAAESPTSSDALFFSIAYGSSYKSSDGSCSLDNSYSASHTSGILHGLTAQCTMQLMANNSVTNPGQWGTGQNADANAQAALCHDGVEAPGDPSHRFFNVSVGSSLEGVFQEVGSALTTPRLISNNAT